MLPGAVFKPWRLTVTRCRATRIATMFNKEEDNDAFHARLPRSSAQVGETRDGCWRTGGQRCRGDGAKREPDWHMANNRRPHGSAESARADYAGRKRHPVWQDHQRTQRERQSGPSLHGMHRCEEGSANARHDDHQRHEKRQRQLGRRTDSRSGERQDLQVQDAPRGWRSETRRAWIYRDIAARAFADVDSRAISDGRRWARQALKMHLKNKKPADDSNRAAGFF